MSASGLAADPLLASLPVHEGYKVLGGVVLYQKLGRGGMGAVYRGRHLRLNIDVAVKVMAFPDGMSPRQAGNSIQRFIREAQTAASVRHQNLIRVYDVNVEDGTYYLVMDFVDGESAGERLKRRAASGRKGLAEAEAIQIALGAADGLAEAHARGIVHRDVKPDNVLIDKRGAVVVADLGLAKAFGGGGEESALSALSMGLSVSQQAIGTPFYMSPEQTRSSKEVGPGTDVWSLGVTLYQLVSGERPWVDTDLVELLGKIRKEPPPDIRQLCPGLSEGACAIIEKSLRKEPAERYADCGEMARALRKHAAETGAADKKVLADPQAGSGRLLSPGAAPPATQGGSDPKTTAPPSHTMTLIAQSLLGTDATPPTARPADVSTATSDGAVSPNVPTSQANVVPLTPQTGSEARRVRRARVADTSADNRKRSFWGWALILLPPVFVAVAGGVVAYVQVASGARPFWREIAEVDPGALNLVLLLMTVGLSFMLLDAVVVSFGLLTVAGVGCAAGAAYVAFRANATFGTVLLALVTAGVPLWCRFVAWFTRWTVMVLQDTAVGSGRTMRADAAVAAVDIGDAGVAASPLRPSGIADFDGHRIGVSTRGELVETGTPIEVVEMGAHATYVRARR